MDTVGLFLACAAFCSAVKMYTVLPSFDTTNLKPWITGYNREAKKQKAYEYAATGRYPIPRAYFFMWCMVATWTAYAVYVRVVHTFLFRSHVAAVYAIAAVVYSVKGHELDDFHGAVTWGYQELIDAAISDTPPDNEISKQLLVIETECFARVYGKRASDDQGGWCGHLRLRRDLFEDHTETLRITFCDLKLSSVLALHALFLLYK
jgi:hypothetical protein